MSIEHFTHYSPEEGGDWLEFDKSVILPVMPEIMAVIEGEIKNNVTEIEYGRFGLYKRTYIFHALKTNTGRIWDCINYWRPSNG